MTKALTSAILKNIDKQEYEMPDGSAWQQDHARIVEFFLDQPKEDLETVAEVLYGLQDLQVRDYAMGIMRQNDLTHKVALKTLIKYSSGKYQKPPKTLLALWHWENGENTKAQQSLLKIKKYNLADLLTRSMAAGWPSKELQIMRQKLHPKVCVNIFGEKVNA
jgi:hypothetical protein